MIFFFCIDMTLARTRKNASKNANNRGDPKHSGSFKKTNTFGIDAIAARWNWWKTFFFKSLRNSSLSFQVSFPPNVSYPNWTKHNFAEGPDTFVKADTVLLWQGVDLCGCVLWEMSPCCITVSGVGVMTRAQGRDLFKKQNKKQTKQRFGLGMT